MISLATTVLMVMSISSPVEPALSFPSVSSNSVRRQAILTDLERVRHLYRSGSRKEKRLLDQLRSYNHMEARRNQDNLRHPFYRIEPFPGLRTRDLFYRREDEILVKRFLIHEPSP